MKRTFVYLLFSCLCCAWAMADVITVPVVWQLQEGEEGQLPEKTIEVSQKVLKYKKQAPAHIQSGIDSLLTLVCDNAFQGRTYELTLTGNGENATVHIVNADPTLKHNKADNNYYGALVCNGRHFLVIIDNSNDALIKSLLENDRDKVKYVREYEFTPEIIEVGATTVDAIITSTSIDVAHAMVEGEECVHKD